MKYRTHKANLTEKESKEIKKLYDSGMKICDIGRKFNRAKETIVYHTWSKEKRLAKLLRNKQESKKKGNKAQVQNIAYLNTENGFIVNKYHDILKSYRKKQAREINADKKIELISQEEFFELWTQHKAKQGITCGYTGEPLVMQRKIAPKVGRNKPPKNQLSVDCLDPEIGYTKNNIVFCSWGFNDRKNAVKIKDCYLIIKKHEERNKNEK